jgi:HNH endonuclease
MAPTAERVRELFEHDPVAGVLRWRIRTSHRIEVGDIAGHTTSRRGDGQVGIDGGLYQLHCVIWCHVMGEWPVLEIDHIDQNPSNNKMENLRLATRGQNQQNIRQPQSNNRTGVRGVFWNNQRKMFEARVSVVRVMVHRTFHHTLDDAAHAVRVARVKHHPFAPDAMLAKTMEALL